MKEEQEMPANATGLLVVTINSGSFWSWDGEIFLASAATHTWLQLNVRRWLGAKSIALWLSGLCKSQRNSGYSVELLLSSFSCGLHVPPPFHLLASFRLRNSTFFSQGGAARQLCAGLYRWAFYLRMTQSQPKKHSVTKIFKAKGTFSVNSHMRLYFLNDHRWLIRGGLQQGVSKVCSLRVTFPGPAAEFRPTVAPET